MRICTVDGCNNKHKAKGLCSMHYLQEWRASTPDRRCEVEGCTRSDVMAHNLCDVHYARKRHHGDSRYVRAACVIDGCDRVRGNASLMCSVHYYFNKYY